jgi:hypothetical protein
LHELVRDTENGVVFHTSEQLSKQLHDLFSDFPSDVKTLNKLQKGTEEFQKIRWEDNWNEVVSPLLMN